MSGNWDLEKRANVARRLFNDHVYGCQRCDPRGSLCPTGTRLEAAAHRAADRKLQQEIRQKEGTA